MTSPTPNTASRGSSGRALVAGIVVTAAVTLAMVIVREQNKKVMFAMYADMHNLVMAQEAHFADYARYASTFPNGYAPTHGSLVDITQVNDTSFAARATHEGTDRVCSITFVRPRVATEEQLVQIRIEAWKTYDCK